MTEMNGYTKLFGSIIASTIWREDNDTRIVWITMLAMANKNGFVEASIPGLADLSRVSVDKARIAIAKLESPDPDSRSKEQDGRRIMPMDGGWQLVNHAKYRAKLNADERREYFRVNKQKNRSLSTNVQDCPNMSTVSTHTEAEAEAEAEENTDTESGCVCAPSKTKDAIYSPESRVALYWLNEHSGRFFRETDSSLAPINARLQEHGVDLDGVKVMVERMCNMWRGTKLEEYLRPSTLFGKEKFNEYYASKDLPLPNTDPSTIKQSRSRIAV